MSSKNAFMRVWRRDQTATRLFFESEPITTAVNDLFDASSSESDDGMITEPTAATADTFMYSDGDESRSFTLPSSDSEDDAIHDYQGSAQSFEQIFTGTHALFSEEQQLALRDKIAEWASNTRPTRDQANGILGILNVIFPSVPKDVRTLLGTDQTIVVSQKCGGDYTYFGIQKVLADTNLLQPNSPPLDLHINVDGLPLYSSKAGDFWPILMRANGNAPVVVALYYGSSKPNSVHEFMSDFIEEYQQLSRGFEYKDITFTMKLSAVICDAPARAFLKQIVSHNAYYGCERCVSKGLYSDRRVCFDEMSAALRSDGDFAEYRYEGTHQAGLSPLVQLVGCITQFPLDYMHLVCLGVMRRLVRFWKSEKTSLYRLSPAEQRIISDRLQKLHGKMPSEFARQPRALAESDRWKATEWRQFLLYTGVTVLKGVLSEAHYYHFLCLSVAMSILLDENDEFRNRHLQYARDLLCSFVRESVELYGRTFISYNVHSLLHIADDCVTYGVSLNKLSAFAYENFLGRLKPLVRNANNPVVQVAKRLSECHRLVGTKDLRTKLADNYRDGFVKLKNGDVCVVTDACYSDSKLTVRRIPKGRVSNLFTVPCESIALGICSIRRSLLKELPQVVIKRDQICKKVVCLPFNEESQFALIPVHHNDE